MAYQNNAEPDKDIATRSGEFAMLIFSIGRLLMKNLICLVAQKSDPILQVAVVAGSLLPHLARRDFILISHEDEDEDEDVEVSRLRNNVQEWRAEALRDGRPLRLPLMPFLLRNIWTGALLLFTILTFSTFFVSTVLQVCFS